MNSITSRIQKKFDELWYGSNVKSIDGIWKRMNKDGFKISNYQVRHLVHEKRREYIRTKLIEMKSQKTMMSTPMTSSLMTRKKKK